jgi:hypothetical protein
MPVRALGACRGLEDTGAREHKDLICEVAGNDARMRCDFDFQGAPHSLADLEKVAAGQARTIIMMQPDNIEARTCHFCHGSLACRHPCHAGSPMQAPW